MDAGNRLWQVESRSDVPSLARRKVVWEYDALGRRIRQITSDGSSGTWQVTEDFKFMSDPLLFGRHIAELRASDNALVRSYVWGLDLSGTMDGAGGVGGLLWLTQHTGPNAGAHFAAYDGNGNIVALSAASDGSVSARYEYGPFGEPIRVTGPAAGPSPFRFSTKRTDSTTDLVLYEYRLYNPSLGRWLSRDPMWELGFTFGTTGERLGRAQDFDEDEEPRIRLPHQETESLYGFVVNAPINHVDPLGLISFNQCFEDQIMQLRQAWEEMCSLLRDPKFRCCVGRSQLLQMFERRCSWGNVKFKCRRNDQGLCPWACAHAWQSLGVGRGVIVVCDRQFYNPFECRLSLKCVLAHEMTHILGGTPFDHGVVEKVTKCCVNN